MSSFVLGNPTSKSEVTYVSDYGVWLLSSSGKELYMSYDLFPWFKNQSKAAIHDLEEPTPGHFYWPQLDVDLSENIIENPCDFPLSTND